MSTPNSSATLPETLPDVATEPHPTGHVDPISANVPSSSGSLGDALPAIHEAARKVGGYRQLAEIAKQLGESDTRK